MKYKCKENDCIIELGREKDEILVSEAGDKSKIIIGLKDLNKALVSFGVKEKLPVKNIKKAVHQFKKEELPDSEVTYHKKLITLSQIEAVCAYSNEWKKLLEYSDKIGRKMDDEFEITDIIISNSIGYATRALRVLEGFDKEKRLFACDCAMLVIDVFEKEYPKDKRPRTAIEVSQRFANGEATVSELHDANADACLAAWNTWAAYAASFDTYDFCVIGAARDAAWTACAASEDDYADCSASSSDNDYWKKIQKLFTTHFKSK